MLKCQIESIYNFSSATIYVYTEENSNGIQIKFKIYIYCRQ